MILLTGFVFDIEPNLREGPADPRPQELATPCREFGIKPTLTPTIIVSSVFLTLSLHFQKDDPAQGAHSPHAASRPSE